MKINQYYSAFILSVLILTVSCETPPPDEKDNNSVESKQATADPKRTEGPYKPDPIDPNRTPNEGYRFDPVPTGDTVGNFKPNDPATRVRVQRISNDDLEIEKEKEEARQQASLEFKKYKNLDDAAKEAITCCPEPSVAENGQTILLSGNFWLSLSKDGGNTFDVKKTSSIFPTADKGFCCDQVLHYVKEIDMFILLYQTWRLDGTNTNRVRVAAATTEEVINSNATAWTFWDFPSSVIADGSWLDFSDVAVGNNSLYFATNSVGRGRVVCRLPLDQIQAKSSITYRYSPPLDNCGFSRISQDTGDEAFWGGHDDNSTLRVYSWQEASTTIFWRRVKVNSWPNTPPYTAVCPDGVNWVKGNAQGFAWYGVARDDDDIWVAWPAAAGGGFPQTHVRLAKVNTNTYTTVAEHQIWNENFAFNYPNIATNREGEVGISIGFGGNTTMYGQHGVGVWGDYVIYTPKMADLCTERWGDYTTVRRGISNTNQWVSSGYLNATNASGNIDPIPHYIRFGR
ncbi:MAG: hypothetical protein AAFN93_08090 [Bacteroidota bacterium]